MKVYWITWITVIFLAWLAQSNDYIYPPQLTENRIEHSPSARTAYFLAAGVLIFVAGFRYRVGTDFGAYYFNFMDYANDFWDSLKQLNEPGIRFLYLIASKFSSNNAAATFSAALVTLGLELIVIYRNTDRIGFAVILFMFMCWSACFNGVRQALACAVLFCGLPALRDKDFKGYALAVLLAFLFHRSAAVMILVYFMAHWEVNLKNVFLLAVASVVVLFSYDFVFTVVNVVLEHDLTGEEAYWSTQVNILRTATKVVPAVFFLIVYWNKEKTDAVNFYLNMLLVHAVVAVVASNSAAIARMSMYTSPFALIAIAELIKAFPDGTRQWIASGITALYWFMEWFEISKSDSLNHFQWVFGK